MAFPVKDHDQTFDLDNTSKSFNDFRFVFNGYEDQSFDFRITEGGVAVDLVTDGYEASFKVTKQPTAQVRDTYIYVETPSITISDTNRVQFSVAKEDIPPNTTYLASLVLTDPNADDFRRILAKGKIDVRDSLYSSDEDFCFPVNVNRSTGITYLTDADNPYTIDGFCGSGRTYFIDEPSSNFIVNLPESDDDFLGSWNYFIIKNSGSNTYTLTINPEDDDSIDDSNLGRNGGSIYSDTVSFAAVKLNLFKSNWWMATEGRRGFFVT